MERILSSVWFLAATAICCGVAMAFTTWATEGSPADVRALASLIGFGCTLAVMLLVAWALASDEDESTVTARVSSPEPRWPAATALQSSTSIVHEAPSATSPDTLDEGRIDLTRRLEEGRTLRAEIAAAADPRISLWIGSVRQAIESYRPGLLGYFDALSGRTYASDSEKLDAYLRRLATIVRDLI